MMRRNLGTCRMTDVLALGLAARSGTPAAMLTVRSTSGCELELLMTLALNPSGHTRSITADSDVFLWSRVVRISDKTKKLGLSFVDRPSAACEVS